MSSLLLSLLILLCWLRREIDALSQSDSLSVKQPNQFNNGASKPSLQQFHEQLMDSSASMLMLSLL